PRARPRPWRTPSVVLHSPDHQGKEERRQRRHGALVPCHEDMSAEAKDRDELPMTEARNHFSERVVRAHHSGDGRAHERNTTARSAVDMSRSTPEPRTAGTTGCRAFYP